MKKIKITVMCKVCHADLIQKYENPIKHACDMQVGHVFIADGWQRPEGLCESAWESMSAFVMTLAHGGGNFYNGWMKNPKSAMISCNDGFRPVSFLIETIEEDYFDSINPQLMQYVENSILPIYSTFDAGHQISHALHVINSSLNLAQKLNVDLNMAYTIAAFHDLGLEGQRETHHLLSGEILEKNENLKTWFSPEQITIMREAVEDHRASAKQPPRSIFGKIVSDADRDLTPEHIIRRCIQFGLFHHRDFSKEQHYLRTIDHLKKKYGENGYIQLWLKESDNAQKLTELRSIIHNPTIVRDIFDRIYEEETK